MEQQVEVFQSFGEAAEPHLEHPFVARSPPSTQKRNVRDSFERKVVPLRTGAGIAIDDDVANCQNTMRTSDSHRQKRRLSSHGSQPQQTTDESPHNVNSIPTVIS